MEYQVIRIKGYTKYMYEKYVVEGGGDGKMKKKKMIKVRIFLEYTELMKNLEQY